MGTLAHIISKILVFIQTEKSLTINLVFQINEYTTQSTKIKINWHVILKGYYNMIIITNKNCYIAGLKLDFLYSYLAPNNMNNNNIIIIINLSLFTH